MIKLNNHPQADTFEDLPECFRPVAQAHGRALYEFVLNVQLAGEASERLAAAADRAGTSNAATALRMLTQSFNAIANAYAAASGWGEADLVGCKQAIEVAFAAQAEAVETVPRLILDS